MANIDIFDCMGFVLTFKHTLLLKKGGGWLGHTSRQYASLFTFTELKLRWRRHCQ